MCKLVRSQFSDRLRNDIRIPGYQDRHEHTHSNARRAELYGTRNQFVFHKSLV